MTPSDQFERHIPFEEAFNFRDLGGYHTQDGRTVRWRHLFRAGELQYMSQSDVELARTELGIKTVFDLRDPTEIHERGVGPLVKHPIRHFNFSLIPNSTQAMASALNITKGSERYVMRMERDDFWSGVLNIMEILAGGDTGPSVFHCTFGKDRTGQLAAILLGVLGVNYEDIVADYEASNRDLEQAYNRIRNDPDRVGFIDTIPSVFRTARPEIMSETIEAFNRKYGSMRGFAMAHGVTPVLVRQLEELLLVQVAS